MLTKGLNRRWDAGIWYRGDMELLYADYYSDRWGEKTWRWVTAQYRKRTDEVRYIPILEDGAGYCQIETDKQDPDVFIGNFLVCDRAEVFITVVKAQRGRCSFVVNNPSEKPLTFTVRPAKGFELTGRWERKLTLPAGGFKEITVTAR